MIGSIEWALFLNRPERPLRCRQSRPFESWKHDLNPQPHPKPVTRGAASHGPHCRQHRPPSSPPEKNRETPEDLLGVSVQLALDPRLDPQVLQAWLVEEVFALQA